MIRKIFLLTLLSVVFLYMLWNFYADALRYDPLDIIEVKKAKPKKDRMTEAAYKQFWDNSIHEKNLFSPYRSYSEPKPVSAVPPPPPPKKPELSLKGIIIDSFGEYVAYLEIDKAKAMPLRKGDKVDDIEIVDITERKVVLKWIAETINLNMEKIKTISGPRQPR